MRKPSGLFCGDSRKVFQCKATNHFTIQKQITDSVGKILQIKGTGKSMNRYMCNIGLEDLNICIQEYETFLKESWKFFNHQLFINSAKQQIKVLKRSSKALPVLLHPNTKRSDRCSEARSQLLHGGDKLHIQPKKDYIHFKTSGHWFLQYITRVVWKTVHRKNLFEVVSL